MDKDLQSIQEARDLMKKAKNASKVLQNYTQAEVDKIVKAMAEVCYDQAERLAKMAQEETGFGVWQDKVLKNVLGSKTVYEYIRDMKKR